LGVLMGIAVAVTLSLVIVIFESVRPQITILWRIPGTTIYRPLKQESSGAFIPSVFICRIGSSMYFANASYIKDTLLQYILDLQEVNPIKYIILEMTPVVSIDSTAMHIIEDIYSEFKRMDVQLAFAMLGNRVDRSLRKSEIKKHIGEKWFFPTVNDAVQYCVRHRSVAKMLTAKDQTDAASPAVDVSEIALSHANEVGISNDINKDCTMIFITLSQDVPMIMSAITALFKSNKVSVHKAEIEQLPNDGAKHTYLVKSSKTGSQLVEHEIERLREELGELLERHQGSKHLVEFKESSSREGSGVLVSNRMQELERRIRDQDAKLDRINELLSAPPARQRDDARCCLPRVLP